MANNIGRRRRFIFFNLLSMNITLMLAYKFTDEELIKHVSMTLYVTFAIYTIVTVILQDADFFLRD